MVEKRQVKIAGNGEHIGDTDLDQAPRQVAAKCSLRRGDDGGGDGILDGANRAVGWATDSVVGGFASIERSDFGVH